MAGIYHCSVCLFAVAVVDENVPNAQQNLEVAVAAVNENPEVLNGHELILHSVISRDNDSFCNTDQGNCQIYMCLEIWISSRLIYKLFPFSKNTTVILTNE